MSAPIDPRLDIGLDEFAWRIERMRASAARFPGLSGDLLAAHADDLESTLDYMRGTQR